MTIWHFLLSVCLFSPLSSSMVEAHHSHAGLTGYAIAFAMGLPLGIALAWMMWIASKHAMARILVFASPSASEWLARLLFATQCLWIAMGLTLGSRLFPVLLQLIG